LALTAAEETIRHQLIDGGTAGVTVSAPCRVLS